MSLFDNPTAAFTNTNLYRDYQTYKSKVQDIYNRAQNAGCDSNTLLQITGLQDEFDLVFNTYANAAKGIYDSIVSVKQCVSNALNTTTLDGLHNQMSQTAQDILNSRPVQSFLGAIDQIVDALDRNEDCNSILNKVQNARNEANNQINKANSVIDTLSRYSSFIDDIGQTLGKISSVVNCLKTGGSQVAYYSSIFDPDNYQIINEITQDETRPVQERIQQGIQKMKQVKDVENKLISFTNSLKI